MGAQENVQIVKDGYAAFGRGDIQSLLALFADDIEWISPGALPLSGTFHGHAEVAGFFQKVSELIEYSSFEPREFLADGDRVVVLGFSRGKAKTTNKPFEIHWVMAFTVRNGKVTGFREYNDTLVAARAFEVAAGAAA